jgi:hypothetical protein
MTKVATKFYSAAVSHRELNGIYMGSFGIPGEAPQWVTKDGKPELFTSHELAEIAGWRILAAKLSKAHDVQSFMVKRSEKNRIRTYHAPERRLPTSDAERVFAKFKS